MSNDARGPQHGRTASEAFSIASEATAVAESRASSSSSSATINEDRGELEAKKELSKGDDGDESDDDSIYQVAISVVDQAGRASARDEEQNVQNKKQIATWSQLPRKGQLALLTISRLSEPLTQTGLQSYMWYMLKNFDPSLPDSTISSQVGLMQAAFTVTQFVTAIAWGRAADSEKMGRKKVLMIGLFGTMVSALGFGFSKSFATAMFFRSLGGALNGNVGVMRTVRAFYCPIRGRS
jgi:MFS transporter